MRKKNLVGKKFGRLTVIRENGKDKWGKIKYLCQCECGGSITTLGRQLTLHRTKSCGCYRKDRVKQTNTSNGDRGTKEYTAWRKVYHLFTSYKDFLSVVGKSPHKDYILTTIDSSKPKSRDNLHWAPTFTKTNYSHILGNRYGYLTAVSVHRGVPTKIKCVCDCGEQTYVTPYNLSHNVTGSCGKCRKYVFSSKGENEIATFIEELGFTIIRNDRTILSSGKEIDIVIPDLRIAIEYDGVYWHSTKKHKDKYNLLHKSKECEEAGYRCIHILENVYMDSPNKVFSLLQAQLGIFQHRIGARNTTKISIDRITYSSFCNKYHLQGARPAHHMRGLMYGDILVAVIGYNDNGELIRYAVKHDCIISGALPKLIKDERITYSYCDRTFFSGSSYAKAGFTLSKITAPNFYYVKNGLVVSRNQMMKHKLKDKLSIFNESLTEEQNCNNNGWYRLYDCGNILFTR